MLASEVLIHILNFIAPAFWMACFLGLCARFLGPGPAVSWPWSLAWLVVALVGVATLLAGLWLTGRDGKMATYIALVLTCGSTQWMLGRAWRL
jgi:hypothetical protein